jgi:hypothetical protein
MLSSRYLKGELMDIAYQRHLYGRMSANVTQKILDSYIIEM